MDVAFLSFLAGALTVLSPCILPFLPVVLSGSLSTKDKWATYVIIGSSALSIILFTLLLKGTSVFLGVPSSVWFVLSGIIIIFIGITLLFPAFWARLSHRLKLEEKSGQLTTGASRATGQKKNVLLGLSLGPVFTSCSPTYGLIVAAVLPVNFLSGVLYIVLYALGLALILLLIAFGGSKIVDKLRWFTKPAFTRTLGIILIVTGLVIATGLIKELEQLLIESGLDLTRLEWSLLNNNESLGN